MNNVVLDFVLDEVLFVGKEEDKDSIIIENCEDTDDRLEKYKVLAKSDRVSEIIDKIPKVTSVQSSHMKQMLQTTKGQKIVVTFALRNTGKTFTECLLEKYKGVDNLLEHYGLLEPAEETLIEEEDENEPSDVIVEESDDEMPEDFITDIGTFDIDSVDETIEEISVDEAVEEENLDTAEEVIDTLEEVPTIEEDMEEIPVLKEVIEEEEENIPEIEEETAPNVDEEKHTFKEEESYNKAELDEKVSEAVNKVLLEKFGTIDNVANNIGKLVQLMETMAVNSGVPKEKVEEINDPIDDSEILYKEEVEGLIDHIESNVKGIDKSLLEPFISMYDNGNEELVTKLLLEVAENLEKAGEI